MANHFEALSQAADSTLAVKAYLEGSGVQDMLAAIGSTELRTVQKAFENLASADEKRTAIDKALGRLQTAHEKYRKIHQRAAQGWRKDLCMEAMTKDIFVCCLMALCRHYLNSGDAAIARDLATAEAAYASSIYLLDGNDRDRRSSTTQMDVAIGSFLARINREDLTDPDTAQFWKKRGAGITDSLLGASTFVYNAINPFYYKHLGNVGNGKTERIRYRDFAELKAKFAAI